MMGDKLWEELKDLLGEENALKVWGMFNQIAKRKWEEFYEEYLKQENITHFYQFPNWLDKEGEA